jgi:hypothetical protein
MNDYRRKYRNQFVKVAYLLMAISLVLSVSCATMSEKRYVENNTFVSTYPKLAIKVSPEFEYLGEYHGDIFKDGIGYDFERAKVEEVFYIFCQKGDGGDINKGVVIATYTVSEGFYWTSDALKKPGSAMDSGEIKISGKVWPYAVWRTKNFFGPAKDFVQDHGLSTNQHFMVGVISRVIDHTPTGGDALGNTKMAIYYIEDQRICGYDLAQFRNRGLEAVHFIGSESTESKTQSPQIKSTELELPFYISIQQDDMVYEYGKLKYNVQKGDVLEVLKRQTCRTGYGECWMVMNVKTMMIGYVEARRMRELHSLSQTQLK